MTSTTSSQSKPDRAVLRVRHPRVAFVFDFDETLAPNTTDALLRHLGLDAEEFRGERVQPLVEDGWEQRLAEARALVDYSNEASEPITRSVFEEVATKLELYPGVTEMFDRVTDAVTEIEPDLDVEFHLITAGFVQVPQATAIADRFTSIIGGHWAFDDDGAILTPKSTVGHYAKVRHLLALAKGLDTVRSDDDHDVDRLVPEKDWHVSFEQMVFVGDGDSDLPAFELMHERAGLAIAVFQAESADRWESRSDMRDGRQVACLCRSDFSPGSPLLTALMAAGQRAALWAKILDQAER